MAGCRKRKMPPKKKAKVDDSASKSSKKKVEDDEVSDQDEEEAAEKSNPKKRGRNQKKKDEPLKNKSTTDYHSQDFSCKSTNKDGEEWNFKIATWNVDGIRAWFKVMPIEGSV